MKLSGKQLSMAWINDKLDPAKINPEKEEFEAFTGEPISDTLFEDAKARVLEELSKVKTRFADYVAKYCKP